MDEDVGVDGLRPVGQVPAASASLDAAAVAHDFRNLLTAIGHGLELLRRGQVPQDLREAEIETLLSAVARGQRLAGELMRFARGEPRLSPPAIDIDQALSSLAPALRGVLGPDIRLDHAAHGDGRLVAIDPCQFDRVMINLASNARDAMPGSGRLSVRTTIVRMGSGCDLGRNRQISGERLQIEVRDTGSGIAEAVRERLFEANVSTKPAGGGLGLSIVRAIVEETGGTIRIESGPGACFMLSFPVCGRRIAADAAIAPQADGLPETAVPGQRPTVLLVEDEEAVRCFAARALAAAGCQVIEAGSGEDALARISGTGPGIDVMVSDLVLPGMDGVALAREVRNRSPQTAIVMVSGYGVNERPAMLAPPPGVRFLAKPYALAQLVALVRQVTALSDKLVAAKS